jgi:hypothetical protein
MDLDVVDRDVKHHEEEAKIQNDHLKKLFTTKNKTYALAWLTWIITRWMLTWYTCH